MAVPDDIHKTIGNGFNCCGVVKRLRRTTDLLARFAGIPALAATQTTISATLALNLEGMQTHVSMPSDDKRNPFVTLEYDPAEVLRIAWQSKVEQWSNVEAIARQRDCMAEVTVKKLHVRHREYAGGAGDAWTIVHVDLTVDVLANGKMILNNRNISRDNRQDRTAYFVFTTSRHERFEIYSRIAFEVLAQAFDAVLNEVATGLQKECVAP